ncbi:uncharacterized protein VTP21DRAFT_6973 [Calcarisporiella thermophila]|uniref:uncharacterized protein n=1 Tax=Calcarisporiella thermophila TaxID=911321 RepID=UPI00374203E7
MSPALDRSLVSLTMQNEAKPIYSASPFPLDASSLATEQPLTSPSSALDIKSMLNPEPESPPQSVPSPPRAATPSSNPPEYCSTSPSIPSAPYFPPSSSAPPSPQLAESTSSPRLSSTPHAETTESKIQLAALSSSSSLPIDSLPEQNDLSPTTSSDGRSRLPLKKQFHRGPTPVATSKPEERLINDMPPPLNSPSPSLSKKRPEPQPSHSSSTALPDSASTTSAKRVKTSHPSSLAAGGEQVRASDSSELYCLCRQPYDPTLFMIACDGCDQWYHGGCVGVNEAESELVDLYYCPTCTATGKKSSWKTKCSSPSCQKPARVPRSKYCSDQCGLHVARLRLRLFQTRQRQQEQQKQENKPSADLGVSRAERDDRKRLTAVRDQKVQVRRELKSIGERASLLRRVIQNAKAAEARATAAGEEVVCGFQACLVKETPGELASPPPDDEELNRGLAEGMTIANEEGLCRVPRRKCSKHQGWQTLKLAELDQDKAFQNRLLADLEREERQLIARMQRRKNDLAARVLHGTVEH